MNSIKQQDTILLEDHFTEEQYAQWKEFHRDWQRSSYTQVIAAQQFTQDCIDCGSILLKLEIKIDENGNCTKLYLLESIIDSKRPQADQQKLIASLFQNIHMCSFPPFLYNKTVQVRMGKAMKC